MATESTEKKNGFVSRWEPIEDVSDIFSRFNHFMNRIWRESLTHSSDVWVPRVDVYEDDKEIIITMGVSGVDRKDISVELIDNVLSISGERKLEKEERKDRYLRIERSYGQFSRRLTLPIDADPATLSAACSDGVLRVTMSKKPIESGKVKAIEIK